MSCEKRPPMGGLFFCAWRESGLRRENPAVVNNQGVSGEENGVSLGDEHVSAPADQDDQTGACGQATPMQIICKVMIPESVPSLIQNVTISLTEAATGVSSRCW